ncbi:formate dehydrogenase accessory sulfurtransferase FdhD [Methyloligella sp. 2.7D]|uniref:formate dehydrogenase accessory sulfurtransferase FdhD n=1 Tax=unclassified Methyloligella TaxID=2625955 RepID=UPI00157CEFBC|nr:formate dehydrogenase accessory sulfurtransferase FdhD [Methyloligella sp. GL2]QKP78051.1 formate dehydrogenase accessory sulfurtransferase FdhD [Methyloligella sp. GL2]
MIERLARVLRSAWRSGGFSSGTRAVPQETAIAFTYDTATYAVMMASPGDLEDFAVGFSLTEQVIPSPDAIEQLEIVESDVDGIAGIELRMWLKGEDGTKLARRRRSQVGPTGCGLCGIESLTEALRPPPEVGEGAIYTADEIMQAVEATGPLQALNHETRAVHAAGFWTPSEGVVALREDVGRHNALDKLVGALARQGRDAADGIVVLTSRVSVEMVQKAAFAGAPVIAAVSAPTALAIRMAEAAGITLIAIARKDGFEVFTHPARVTGERTSHVA